MLSIMRKMHKCPICQKSVDVHAGEEEAKVYHVDCLLKEFEPIREKMVDIRARLNKMVGKGK